MTRELHQLAESESVDLGNNAIEDVLTYAMFPQVGWRFLKHRNDASAFEPAPGATPGGDVVNTVPTVAPPSEVRSYSVRVNGQPYHVEIGPGDTLRIAEPTPAPAPATPLPGSSGGETVSAPMAGLVLRVAVREGQHVASGDIVVVMEAMKMETEVRARKGGTATVIAVKAGDSIGANDPLVILA
jgi:oxaloacetate decarboxylase alpha subunit